MAALLTIDELKNRQQDLYIFAIESGKEILANDSYRKPLYELRYLVSVTKDKYQTQYVDLLQQTAFFMQQLPSVLYADYQKPYGLFDLSLKRAIAALKYRRAYMLPKGSNAETCYQQQDMWTLLLFFSALIIDCWQTMPFFKICYFDNSGVGIEGWSPLKNEKVVSFLGFKDLETEEIELRIKEGKLKLIDDLLTPEIRKMLQAYPDLAKEWNAFLSGDAIERSTIHQILDSVESKLFKHTQVAQALKDNGELSTVDSSAQELLPLSVESENEATANAFFAEEDRLKDSTAEQFVSWIRKGITTKKISVNTAKGLIHRTEEGIFLSMPSLWDEFIKNNKTIEPVVKNDDCYWRVLIHHEKYFVCANEHEFYFYYNGGNWKSAYSVLGAVLKPEELNLPNELSEISSHLQFDKTAQHAG